MFFRNKYFVLCVFSIVIVGVYTFVPRLSVSDEDAFDFVVRALILDEQLLSIDDIDKRDSLKADVVQLVDGCLNSNLSMVASGADNFYYFTLTSDVFETRIIRLDYYRNRTVVRYVSLDRHSKMAELKPIISKDIKIGSCSDNNDNQDSNR